MNAHVKAEEAVKLDVDDLEGEICDIDRLAFAMNIVARTLFETLHKASKKPGCLETIYSMQDREREVLQTQIEDLTAATARLRKHFYEVIE